MDAVLSSLRTDYLGWGFPTSILVAAGVLFLVLYLLALRYVSWEPKPGELQGLYRDLPMDQQGPFTTMTMNRWNKIKTALYFLTVLPIHLTVIFVSFILLFVLLHIINIGRKVRMHTVDNEDTLSPPPVPGRVASFFYFTILRASLWGFGFWSIKQEYLAGAKPRQRSEPLEAPIIISNHNSFPDGFLLMYTEPLTASFVARGPVSFPIIEYIGHACGWIYVDRNHPTGHHHVGNQIIKRVAHIMRGASPPIAMFPEATTHNERSLLRFRTGAFLAGEPVRPVLIEYPHSPGQLDLAWASLPNLFHILLIAAQFKNRVVLKHLPVYHPNADEKADPKLYRDNVCHYMAKHWGKPVDYHLVMGQRRVKLVPAEALSPYASPRPSMDMLHEKHENSQEHAHKLASKLFVHASEPRLLGDGDGATPVEDVEDDGDGGVRGSRPKGGASSGGSSSGNPNKPTATSEPPDHDD